MGNCILTRGTGISTNLLWTNPSPENSFPAQTIQLELSKYELVMISVTVANTTTTSTITYNFGRIGDTIGLEPVVYNSTFRRRDATILASGVSFSDGRYYASYGDSHNGEVQNIQVIPYQIFGLY